MKYIKTIIKQSTESVRLLEKRSQNGSDAGLFVSADLHGNSGTVQSGKIASIVPYLFENHWIIALVYDWVTVFGCVPSFDVMIDSSGRLVIVSQKTCLKK